MHIEYKSPMARKETLAYCRRCLAVMLCCVLVFGLTVRTAPGAQAVGAELMIAGSSGGSTAIAGSLPGVGSALLTVAVSALGVDFINGVYNQEDGTALVSAGAYQVGYDLEQWLEAQVEEGLPVAYEWYQEVVLGLEEKGGLAPGDTIEIPQEVAEMIRQWAVENYDFSDGAISYYDYIKQGGDGTYLVFSNVDTSTVTNWNSSSWLEGTFQQVGTLFHCFAPPSFDEDWSYTYQVFDNLSITATYEFCDGGDGNFGYIYKILFSNGASIWSGSGSFYSSVEEMAASLAHSLANYVGYQTLFYVPELQRIYVGTYVPSAFPACKFYKTYYVSVSETPTALETTLTPTSALSEPITAPLTITIPQTISITDVDGYTVPAITDLTSEDLLNPTIDGVIDNTTTGITAGEIAGAIAEALPITGTIAGDQVMEEVAQDPDSLGAVFISKFPFCIPWDIAKTIQLLAAPSVTPRFEFDFLDPMADLVGGFSGDTTIVVDFSEYEIVGQVTRWFSTLMFVYSLAVLTKTYIWTA